MDELFENYNEIDDDWRNERIKAPTQDMVTIEHQFEEYLGEFIVDMTGLLGFSRLKAGDKYEVALRYGKGQVINYNDYS